jgi:hypothetical protein
MGVYVCIIRMLLLSILCQILLSYVQYLTKPVVFNLCAAAQVDAEGPRQFGGRTK